MPLATITRDRAASRATSTATTRARRAAGDGRLAVGQVHGPDGPAVAAARRRPVAAGQQRDPHDVHALPDRRGVRGQARRRTAPGAVRSRAPRRCARGPGSCRWSAAPTASWSSRSARSTASGTVVGDRVEIVEAGLRPPPVSRGEGGDRHHSRHGREPAQSARSACSTSRCPRRVRAAGPRAADLRRACRVALDARLALPAGTPLGLADGPPEPLLQLEWCAPFSGTRPTARCTRSSTRASAGSPSRSARPSPRRWRRAGAGGDAVRAGPGPRRRGAASAATTRPS